MGKQNTNQDNFLGKSLFENRVKKEKKKSIKSNSFWNNETQDQRMTQTNISDKRV